MGSVRIKLRLTILFAIVAIVPFGVHARSNVMETFRPIGHFGGLQSDIRPRSENLRGDAIEPAEKRNSDPLRYAVAFTVIVFISLVLIFIILTRRKRRSEE